MKNLMRIGIVVLAAMTAVGCCGNRYDDPFFTTRGIVLSWDDVPTASTGWPWPTAPM